MDCNTCNVGDTSSEPKRLLHNIDDRYSESRSTSRGVDYTSSEPGCLLHDIDDTYSKSGRTSRDIDNISSEPRSLLCLNDLGQADRR